MELSLGIELMNEVGVEFKLNLFKCLNFLLQRI